MNTYTPNRFCGVRLMIDACVINAQQKIPEMNLIEQWREDQVIEQNISKIAFEEAYAGNNQKRQEKACLQVQGYSEPFTPEQRQKFSDIEQAIFPGGHKKSSDLNDVWNVYLAWYGNFSFVTTDGRSKTQRGILGASVELKALGVNVFSLQEAVDFVREQLFRRDERTILCCDSQGVSRPNWIGQDETLRPPSKP